jgi:hypothetical protein
MGRGCTTRAGSGSAVWEQGKMALTGSGVDRGRQSFIVFTYMIELIKRNHFCRARGSTKPCVVHGSVAQLASLVAGGDAPPFRFYYSTPWPHHLTSPCAGLGAWWAPPPPNWHGLRQQRSRTNTMRGVPYMLGVQMVTCSAVLCHTQPTRLCNAALPLVYSCAHRTSKHHRSNPTTTIW